MPGFLEAVTFVLLVEAGYVNDPRDPGGETKYGISKRAHPEEDIPNLTRDRARAIYREHYWDALNCDALAWPLSLFVFDAAVQHGPSVARALLSESRGDERVFIGRRLELYASLSTWEHFGRGWVNRVARLLAHATRHAPDDNATRVETIVLNLPLIARVMGAARGRLDGGHRVRVRRRTGGFGLKLDIARDDS